MAGTDGGGTDTAPASGLIGEGGFANQQQAGEKRKSCEHRSIASRIEFGVDRLFGQNKHADPCQYQQQIARRRQLPGRSDAMSVKI